MNLLAKVLIGTAGVAAVGAVVAFVAVKETKKEDEQTDSKITVMTKEDQSVIGRIKRFVKKKFIKALSWVVLHMEQIEAVGAVIGLASGVISIAGAIRDYRKGSDLEMKIDELQATIDSTNYAMNNNLLIFRTGMDAIIDKLEIDQDSLKADMETINKMFPDAKRLLA